MGKITDIVPQKKNPKRVNIFLDGEFAFGLSAEIRFEKKLEIEQNLTEKQVANLIESDQIERLLNKALKFLSYRPRSEKEVLDHLRRAGKLKDIEKSEAEKIQYEKSAELVINKLKKMDQIDDKEFVRWWVEQREKFKPRGGRLIKSELLQKGVDKGIIDEVFDDVKETKVTSDENEEGLATKAALKKMSGYKNLESEGFRIKMGQFLARRGFEWSVIKKVVDTLQKNR